MASIKAYTGIMGSGKTYEVVTVVILGALRAGRRVVSNIAGLNHEKMIEILAAEGCQKIGDLVQVTHDDIKKPDFWLTDTGAPAFIQPGDLVAVDEVWRFWDGFGPGERNDRRPASFMNFVRMLRQFVHPETGITCDFVVITQEVTDIHRSVKSVIEETYRFDKLTVVGREDRYRIDIFRKGRTTGKPIRQLFGEYEPKYFGLYKSHSQNATGVAPRELQTDGRGNILHGKFYRLVLPLMIPLCLAAIYPVWSFFNPEKQSIPESKMSQQNGSAAKPSASASSGGGQWRVVGHYLSGERLVFVLSDGYTVRYQSGAQAFKFSALSSEVILPDGSVATSWAFTGAKK